MAIVAVDAVDAAQVVAGLILEAPSPQEVVLVIAVAVVLEVEEVEEVEVEVGNAEDNGEEDLTRFRRIIPMMIYHRYQTPRSHRLRMPCRSRHKNLVKGSYRISLN